MTRQLDSVEVVVTIRSCHHTSLYYERSVLNSHFVLNLRLSARIKDSSDEDKCGVEAIVDPRALIDWRTVVCAASSRSQVSRTVKHQLAGQGT